jgi:hypothetical protein
VAGVRAAGRGWDRVRGEAVAASRQHLFRACRFLALEQDRLVELTWVSDERSRDQHDEAWPVVLARLDEQIARSG